MSAANDPKSRKPNNKVNQYVRFSGVAFQMIATIGLGLYGGMKLDEAYPNKYHIWTVLGSVFAVGISTYLVVKQVMDFSKKNDE